MNIFDFINERVNDKPSHTVNDANILIENSGDLDDLFEMCIDNHQIIYEKFNNEESMVLTFKIDTNEDKHMMIRALQKHIKSITFHPDDLLCCNVCFEPDFIIKFPKLKCDVKDMDDLAISFLNCIDEKNLAANVDRDIYNGMIRLDISDWFDYGAEEGEQDEYISIYPNLNKNEDEIYQVEFKFHIEYNDIDECEALLNILYDNVDKTNNIDETQNNLIGQILYNVSRGKQRGSFLWEKYGGEGWNENSITKNSNIKLIKTQYGKKTLRLLAKRKNKVAYKKWLNEYLKFYVNRCLKPISSYRSMAILMYKMYMERFVCESVKSQEWYEYKETFYEKLDDAVVMRNLLSNKVRNLFQGFYGTEVQDEASKILKNLETPVYKTNVIKEASELFYEKQFLRKKDADLDLFAFTNYVYDCDKCVMRSGYPDDMITLCAGVKYDEYDKDHPSVKKLDKYFKQVFVNRRLRKYFLLAVSSCLKGGNVEKNFYVMSGVKSYNGKSTTQSMIEKGFGEYSCKAPTSLITAAKRTDPNAASPAYEALRNRRIGFIQEPGVNESINPGVMKELSAGLDSIFSRGLHANPIPFIPRLRMFLVCNAIPSVPMEPAIKNRMKIVDFMSEFVNNAPKSEKEQFEQLKFPVDPNFEKNFDELIPVLMWKLVKIYPEYKEKGLFVPQECNISLENFEQANDPLALFLDEMTMKVDDKKTKIKTLYAAYCNWHKMLNINKKIIPYENFFNALVKHDIEVNKDEKPYVAEHIKLR